MISTTYRNKQTANLIKDGDLRVEIKHDKSNNCMEIQSIICIRIGNTNQQIKEI